MSLKLCSHPSCLRLLGAAQGVSPAAAACSQPAVDQDVTGGRLEGAQQQGGAPARRNVGQQDGRSAVLMQRRASYERRGAPRQRWARTGRGGMCSGNARSAPPCSPQSERRMCRLSRLAAEHWWFAGCWPVQRKHARTTPTQRYSLTAPAFAQEGSDRLKQTHPVE